MISYQLVQFELNVTALTVLNTAKTTPFEIKDGIEANDDTRLRYRYLDLRRPEMLENLKLRAKVTHSIRNYLDELEFIDVETPFLSKSTPEGARDYLVPSRVNKGHFLRSSSKSTNHETALDECWF